MKLTEDKVRDKLKELVGCEVGQQTTFKELGFTKWDIQHLENEEDQKNALNCRPDGWYIIDEHNFCLVAEVKASNCKLDQNVKNQLFKYMRIASTRFKRIIGIAYNGDDFLCYKNMNLIDEKIPNNVNHYLKMFLDKTIDKNLIYLKTKEINDILHFKLGVNVLNNRMVLTSCILVAKSLNCSLSTFDNICHVKQKVIDHLYSFFKNNGYLKGNNKLNYLIDKLKGIDFDLELSKEKDRDVVYQLLEAIDNISECINSTNWRGEDVMAIFFNEFTRYKGKSEHGQVFTPEHIASLMFKIADISHKNNVLDACCGSGTFLVKAMAYMINEVNNNVELVIDIKQNRLFGIEMDKSVFSLACANMLIHKDGKSNIECLDSKDKEASEWIKSKKISKVLMNPPYEKKNKPFEIIENVLNSVEIGADCLFLLPNAKLRTNINRANKLLKKHRITHIIKLPDIFQGMASTGDICIFKFKAHYPQNNEKIIGFHIPEDGLETVKNQGRQDINEKWSNELEPYWVNAIKTNEDQRYNTKKIIDPNEYLEYPDDFEEQDLFKEDFEKVILDRILFENPELAEQLEKKSKNNPNGLTQKDLIISLSKIIKEL